jgi:hypothetical protein
MNAATSLKGRPLSFISAMVPIVMNFSPASVSNCPDTVEKSVFSLTLQFHGLGCVCQDAF